MGFILFLCSIHGVVEVSFSPLETEPINLSPCWISRYTVVAELLVDNLENDINLIDNQMAYWAEHEAPEMTQQKTYPR